MFAKVDAIFCSLNDATTLRGETHHCYHPHCEIPSIYRCYYGTICQHHGCEKYMKQRLIDGQLVHLCEECQFRRAIYCPTEEALFLRELDEE